MNVEVIPAALNSQSYKLKYLNTSVPELSNDSGLRQKVTADVFANAEEGKRGHAIRT